MTSPTNNAPAPGGDDLAPCPFCGAQGRLAVDLDDNLYVVECTSCSADVAGQDKAEAIAAWNRRALSAEIAALRAERDALADRLEPRLKRLTFEDGVFSAELTGEAVDAIALSLVSHFKELNVENYYELNLHDRAEPFQHYTVTVQKVGKLSPGQKATAAEARAEAAESALSSAKAKVWEEAAAMVSETAAGFENQRLLSDEHEEATVWLSQRDAALEIEAALRARAKAEREGK